MKKALLLGILFCFLAVNSVFAQSKVAVVDIAAITAQSKEGSKIKAELESLYKTSSQKLQSKEAEVKKLADSINKQKASLSQTALQEKNIELQRKSVELERLQKDLEAELQTKQATKLDALLRDLQPVIQDYAKEKGLDVVFIAQPGMMAYASDSANITADIISRFDIKMSKKGTK